MIGSLLSIWLFGKRPFLQAAMFWFVYLFTMFAISYLLIKLPIPFISLIFSIIIFTVLAHYWLHFDIKRSLILWLISFIIDILIMAVLIFTFLSTYISIITGGLL